MSNNGEFSEEQSEELISHLESGGPSEFEHLRSALNLLAHVTELPPTAIPPVLPSGITQPIPLIPARSTKPRRTVVTSVIVVGILASASLAAAAVTGIGPAPIVNIGHQTAKFVKGVAGVVSHVVTGGQSQSEEDRTATPHVSGLTPAPIGGDESSSNNSGSNEGSENESNVPFPPIPNALTPEAKHSREGKDGNSKDGKSSNESKSSSDGGQSSNSDDSSSIIIAPVVTPAPSPKVEKEHSDSEGQKTPESSITTRLPTVFPSPSSSEQSSDDD